jgi:hypothetical protein
MGEVEQKSDAGIERMKSSLLMTWRAFAHR